MTDAIAVTQTFPATVTILAASLGSRHGYVIENDCVRLQADLVVYDPFVASTKEWALQLWACDDAFSGGVISGHKVAEVWLGSLDDFTPAASSLHATAAFHPPAGGGEFTLVLLLVAGANGQLSEIHGYASYPRRELFVLPRLRGKVAYRIEDTRVIVDVEAIENPRPPENTSGTLALELWALPAPYYGGHFSGAPLAAANLGTLNGQNEWNPEPFDLAFKAPPEGTWYFALMLREWSGTAYTTRDYTTFPQAVFYKAPPETVSGKSSTNAPFTTEPVTTPAAAAPAPAPAPTAPPPTPPRTAPVAPVAAPTPAAAAPAVSATSPAPAASPKPAAPTAPVKPTAATPSPKPAVSPAPKAKKVAAKPAEKVATKPTVKPTAKKVAAAATVKTLSVNSASLAELSAVEGLSEAGAAAIVAGRPYSSLEDVRRIKGMAKKAFTKMKPPLSV